LREKNRERQSGDDGEMERGRRRRGEIWRVGAGGAALSRSGSDGGGGAKGGGGAQDRADVAGVLDAGEETIRGAQEPGGVAKSSSRENFAADLERRHLGMFGVGDAFKRRSVVRRTGKPVSGRPIAGRGVRDGVRRIR